MRKTSVQYVQVEGYQTRYEVVGEGEPVVLVHGLSGSTLWWGRNVPMLAQTYRVYSVDLPGFGAMRSRHRSFVLNKAASWLLQWMEAVGLERVHLIGHSMGGAICLVLAAHHPERVGRLVLAAPALISRISKVQGYFLPLLTGARYMSPSFFGILFYDALRAGPLTLIRTTRDLIAQDTHEDMKQVKAPTLLIWGDHDTLVPVEIGPIVCDEIAGSHLSILKGAGHVCMFDRATEFNHLVKTFLSGEIVGPR